MQLAEDRSEELDEFELERRDILRNLAETLAKSRSEAIEGRRATGIEQIWREDEEFYEGVDEQNREQTNWETKPPGQASVVGQEAHGSSIFLNITRPYCDAAAARVGDMLMPTDDRGWSIKATPIPDLVKIAKGEIPPRIDRQINEAFPQDPDVAQQTKDELVESTKADMDEASEKARAAELRIEDWHVECQFHSEARTIIEDCTRVGTGVLKGPVPTNRKMVAFADGELQVKEEIQPISYRVSYWNCFPDPACGDNIHNGSYFWERADMTRKELMELMGQDYLDDEILAALDEGPHHAIGKFDNEEEPTRRGLQKTDSKGIFQVWYYYGMLSKEDIEAAGCEDCEEEVTSAQIIMVNNRVIKASTNHLDTGEFPFDFMAWQRRSALPWGLGVSRQIRTPQRMINGAGRNLMDNAGIAGGPMLIFDRNKVVPSNGEVAIEPWKPWEVAEGADIDDARKAISFVRIDMVQEDLQAIIQLGLKFAEDVTGLPMLLQGQQGQAPDTVGGMILMTNSASTVLRRLARLFDDRVTEPHIRRYYSYLLQYGEDDEKGDFQIDARGSSALVEREIQSQAIFQMGNLAPNPIYGIDPKKWMQEWMKSQHLDPKRVEYDDEEWKQVVEQMSQPPQDSTVQVAQMRIEAEQAREQLKNERQNMELQFEAAEKERQRQFELFFEQIQQENKALIEAGKQELTATQIEAKFQEHREKMAQEATLSAAKLALQERLSETEVVTPPVEPRGRAEPGKSFQQ